MGIISVTQVWDNLFYILDDTILSFQWIIYDVLWVSGSLMHPPNSKTGSGIVLLFFCYLCYINIIIQYKLITFCCVILPQLLLRPQNNIFQYVIITLPSACCFPPADKYFQTLHFFNYQYFAIIFDTLKICTPSPTSSLKFKHTFKKQFLKSCLVWNSNTRPSS